MENTPTTTELLDIAESAAKGIRDREVMRQAAERLDVLRETIRQRIGTTNIGSQAIHEVRDE